MGGDPEKLVLLLYEGGEAVRLLVDGRKVLDRLQIEQNPIVELLREKRFGEKVVGPPA